MIEQLFPQDVVTAVASSAMWDTSPLPEEAIAILNASARRRREFAAGRACARQALVKFGIRDYPLLNDADGVPVWPNGVVGCLAHCADYCGVAVAREGQIRGLGFDAEPTSPLVDELRGMICSEPERNWIDAHAPQMSCDWYKLLFCAKESAFKAAFPVLRVPFDFWKIQIALRPASSEFMVGFPSPYDAFNDRLAGRFAVSEKYVLAGVTLFWSPAQLLYDAPTLPAGGSCFALAPVLRNRNPARAASTYDPVHGHRVAKTLLEMLLPTSVSRVR